MIRLLSTDFDGTMVNHVETPPVSLEMLEMLADCRNDGVLWAVNTGRTLDHIVEGLEEFQVPLVPDFVLTTEREVFRRNAQGEWEDYGDWNTRCARAHAELFKTAELLLNEIVAFVERQTGAKAIYDGLLFIGVVANDDAEMDYVVEFVEKVRARVPQLHYQRNTIYLRFCHAEYHKGAALGELMRLLKLHRDQVFAVGDHYNDLPMLNGHYARWVACPGNAVEAVKEAVRKADGYVATERFSSGIVEALRHFSRNNDAWQRSANRAANEHCGMHS